MSSLPNSRKIVVQIGGNHHSFRWKVSSGRDRLTGMSGPCLTLTVQREGNSGGVFQMHLLSKPYEGQNDYEREHIGVRCTLGPKDVREAIEFALESGWDPTAWESYPDSTDFGATFMAVCSRICTVTYTKLSSRSLRYAYWRICSDLVRYFDDNGYDLRAMIREKMEFNKTRPIRHGNKKV